MSDNPGWDGQGWIDGSPKPAPPPPTGPEWVKPHQVGRDHGWEIRAPECGCSISGGSPGRPLVVIVCPVHSLADLVEGERLLRAEQGNTK